MKTFESACWGVQDFLDSNSVDENRIETAVWTVCDISYIDKAHATRKLSAVASQLDKLHKRVSDPSLRHRVTSYALFLGTRTVELRAGLPVDVALNEPEGSVLRCDAERYHSSCWGQRLENPGSGASLSVIRTHRWPKRHDLASEYHRVISFPGKKFEEVWTSPEGELAVTVSGRTMYVMDGTGECLWIRELPDEIRKLLFFPHGPFVLCVFRDTCTVRFDVTTGESFPLPSLSGWSIAISPCMTFFATGRLMDVVIWDVFAQEEVRSFQPDHRHGRPVSALCFDGTGRRLVTACGRSVDVWDFRSGTCVYSLEASQYVNFFSFSAEQNRCLSGSAFHWAVELWDLDRGCSETIHAVRDSQLSKASFGPGSQVLILCRKEGTLSVWDREKGLHTVLTGATKLDESFCYNPRSRSLFCCSRGQVHVWRILDGDGTELKPTATEAKLFVNGDVVWNPDGSTFVITSGSEAHVWDSASGDLVATLKGHTGKVICVDFSFHTNLIATGSEDGTFRVWDGSTAECILEYDTMDAVWSLAFSPRGTHVLASSRNESDNIQIWQVETGKVVKSWPVTGDWITDISHSISVLRFHPKGSLVLYASGKWLTLLNVKTGRTVDTWDVEDQVNAACFSPDGSACAAVVWHRSVSVWSVSETDGISDRLFYSAGTVFDVTFSPGGERVAANDGSNILVWSLETQTCVLTLRGHVGIIKGLSWIPVDRIVSVSGFGEVFVWDLDVPGFTKARDAALEEAGAGNAVVRVSDRGPAAETEKGRRS
eukprot:Rmarinus@m.11944